MSRRARGEGTIYYDESRERWIGAVTIAGRRRKVSGKDKTEARANLAALLATKATDAPVANRKVTVDEILTTFLGRELPTRTRNGRPLSPSTMAVYEWTSKLISDEIGSVRLAELSPDDVEAMFDRLHKRKDLSAASLRKVRTTLRRAIAFAVRRGDAVRNVAEVATITPTAAATATRTALMPDAARTLLGVLRGERLGPMFALQLRVALRPGEAAGLYWDDIDGATLNVTRAVRLTNGRAEVVDDLKVETARRTIEMPADMADWLAEHRSRQLTERIAASAWADDRLVFASPTGNVLSPPNVRRDLNRICAAAGIPRVTPNELRHSCASLLSDQGVSNEHIADLLGHTTTRMVDQTYRHRLRPVVDIAAKADWASGSE